MTTQKKRALISVFRKEGIVDLGKGLVALGFEILSTGGTATALAEAGVPVTSVSEVTGFPEILGGRVKTLHPKVFGGILAKLNYGIPMVLTTHSLEPLRPWKREQLAGEEVEMVGRAPERTPEPASLPEERDPLVGDPGAAAAVEDEAPLGRDDEIVRLAEEAVEA